MLSVGSKVLSRGALLAPGGRNPSRVLTFFSMNGIMRAKSSSAAETKEVDEKGGVYEYSLQKDGHCHREDAEVIKFPKVPKEDPAYNAVETPILMNAKEHVVGYLSKILNARVYDAAIETELQHAKNLSTVRGKEERTNLKNFHPPNWRTSFFRTAFEK